MPLQLIAFDDHPGRVAVTKIGSTLADGRFFLDFTRSLEVIRWLGIRNRFVGLAVGLLVPVVHEGENTGAFVISVDASDPYFGDLRAMWNEHFPSSAVTPRQNADEIKLMGDFGSQFPQDA
jgi:hypothetical protein